MEDEYSLENRARSRREDVDRYLEMRVQQANAGIHRTDDAEGALDLQRKLDSGRIAQLMGQTLLPGEILRTAILARTVMFCMQAADVMAGRHVQLDIEKIKDKFTDRTTADDLRDEAYDYLRDNYDVGQLVDDYIFLLDSTESSPTDTEVVCGLTFKWLDEQIEVDYLNGMYGHLSE